MRRAILSCACLLALVLVGDSPAETVRGRESVSPGCQTRSCAARVCRSSACSTRAARKLARRRIAARALYWKRERAKLSPATVAMLDRLASCETRGIPRWQAYRWDGHHDGRYQYDEATWAQAGGYGKASDASPAEQDVRTARFFPGHRAQWACRA